jgi:hypothetical protein
MSQAIIVKSGGGGITSDDVTATKNQVLQGVTALTSDSYDEAIEGTIQVVDTGLDNNNYNKQPTAYGIDGNRGTFYIDLPHGNGYYCRSDGHPHTCVDSDKLGDAKAGMVVEGNTFTSKSGVCIQGTIPNRGYHGPDSHEMWLFLQEGGYVTRFREGYYHNDGEVSPYVIVPTAMVKQAVNYHSEKTLSDTVTCGEQGQIKIVNTQDNNYRVNKAATYGIDNWSDVNNWVFYVDLPHGNAYYSRSDGHPHVCIDATNLGTADANSVLQWQTATSQYGVKFSGTIPRWICNTGDVISATSSHSGQGFVYDDPWRGRGIVSGIPNGHYIQGANYVFLPSPNLLAENVRENVNINGVTGTLPDYRVGRPVFENATFNMLYVGGVANKDFPEAKIYRDRTQSHNNYSKYIGGTTIDVRAGSNYHLSAFSNYVGFILDRAILFTFFRQLKVTYKLNMNMHTGRYNRTAGVNIFVFIYDVNNRSRNIGDNQATHRSGDNIESVHNENTYELIVDTSMINQDGFVALCADAYSDDNLSSAIGSVTFTKIELIN